MDEVDGMAGNEDRGGVAVRIFFLSIIRTFLQNSKIILYILNKMVFGIIIIIIIS